MSEGGKVGGNDGHGVMCTRIIYMYTNRLSDWCQRWRHVARLSERVYVCVLRSAFGRTPRARIEYSLRLMI